LQRLWKSAQVELEHQLRDLVRAVALFRVDPSHASEMAVRETEGDLARRQAELAALTDLMGRRRMMRELRRAGAPLERFSIWHGSSRYVDLHLFDVAQHVPKVPFRDAIRDIVNREPQLADTAQQVAAIYQEHGFSAVHAQTQKVLDRVQAYMGTVKQQGIPIPKAAEIVAGLADWTKAYAHTVVRTNLTTAYAAGRFAQLKDPAIKALVPALRFVTVQEPYDPKTRRGTRPNHRAAHGLVAAVDDPVWDKVSPPLGYNCRCTVALVTRAMLARMGKLEKNGDVKPAKIPANAGPDEGFTHAGRPDLSIYGG
jgi:SPP1 gp7 family putative phage head morphogenesis protein